MSQSAMPATENNMTTCLETFEKDTFCSFPHRHADATGKPETRDETRGRKKTSISCETSSNFDIFDTLSNRHAKQHDNLLGNLRKVHILQLPHIDTATPQENQRLETRHVGAEKQAFRARLPPSLTFSTRYQTGWNVTKCHAWQNDMTTFLETFEKETFCSFPHRHGEATIKPMTRDETSGSTKTSISCETSSTFNTL